MARRRTILDWINGGPDYRGLRSFFQELSDRLRAQAWEKDPFGDPGLKALSLSYWNLSTAGSDRMLVDEALLILRTKPEYVKPPDLERLRRILGY